MKKAIALILTMVLLLSLSATAFADTIQTGDKNIDVTAQYNQGITTPDVYSVDIQWEGMTFVYNESGSKVWNPATHTYTDNTTAGWVDNTAAITVTNHSNVAVTAEFTYAPVEGTGVTGTLDVSTGELAAGEVNDVDGADSVVSTLTISGVPTETVTAEGVVVGIITVSIS